MFTQPILVIRKRGNEYICEEIKEEQSRKDIISGLKDDSSVVLFFDTEDEFFEDHADLFDGFEIIVSVFLSNDLGEYDVREGRVTILYNQEIFYKSGYVWGSDDDRCKRLRIMVDDAVRYLNELDEGNYHYFMSEDEWPGGFSVKRMDIFNAQRIMSSYGLQTEYIEVLTGYSPMMYVEDNEVIFLGSRHFGEYGLFIEIKRLGLPTDEAHRAKLRQFGEAFPRVDVIFWEDGSVGFRSWFPLYQTDHNFQRKLRTRFSEIKELSTLVEDKLHCPYNAKNDMIEIRQRFIYEAIEASAKLVHIHI